MNKGYYGWQNDYFDPEPDAYEEDELCEQWTPEADGLTDADIPFADEPTHAEVADIESSVTAAEQRIELMAPQGNSPR